MLVFFETIGAFFIMLWTIICSLFPAGGMAITVEPTVFDCGNEYYSVVWVTSTKGSGYVKYTYDGEEKILWDSVAGNIRTDDTIHTVRVPKKELQGNDYVVGSQYIPYKFGYTAAKGKSIESQVYSFRGVPKDDDIKILSISDIHHMEPLMKQSLKYFSDQSPDIVALLGDVSSAMETKDAFVNSLLKNSAYLSGSIIPVIYSRGNHETRGEFSAQMLRYIPTETNGFYFTFEFGSLGAIVIDTAEDKEDNHREYSGLVNFEEYRKEEYKWLAGLETSEFENCRYKLVFSHDPTLEDVFGQDWTAPLKKLGMELIIGGHYHKPGFIQEEGKIPVFFDCGKDTETVWAASMITLENDRIHMLTIDNSGNTLVDETIG